MIWVLKAASLLGARTTGGCAWNLFLFNWDCRRQFPGILGPVVVTSGRLGFDVRPIGVPASVVSCSGFVSFSICLIGVFDYSLHVLQLWFLILHGSFSSVGSLPLSVAPDARVVWFVGTPYVLPAHQVGNGCR